MAKSKIKQNQLIFRMVLIGFFIFIAGLIYFLFFMHAKVSIEVVPTSAVVTLDNKPAAVANGSATFVTSLGQHTLRVEADNYVGFKETINLTRGRNYSKKVSLEKSPSPIKIAANAQYVAIKDNDIFYFNPADRLIYLTKTAYDTKGQASVASTQNIISKPLDSFDKLIWSPNKDMVLIQRGGNVSLLDFKKYDFVHQNEVAFGSYIGDITWSPDNSRLAYYYAPPGGERSLIFSDASNQNVFRAANLAQANIENPFLSFSPNSELMAVIPRNQNFDQNLVYLMNVYTRELTAVSKTGNQKEASFSSDSKKIIYSSYSDNSANVVHRMLSAMNLDGSDNKALNIAARASDIRPWKNPNQIFLPINSSRSKMILVDLISGLTSDFYFDGQSNSEISEIFLNDQATSAVFISKNILYFVKLEGNG
ncbi:MAG: PEGA domain-containing protein [Candidatus Berkelbacteria bacterium]